MGSKFFGNSKVKNTETPKIKGKQSSKGFGKSTQVKKVGRGK